LSEVCRESFSLLQIGLPRKITFSSSLSPPGPPIFGNRAQLQQLVTNLITNALESIGINLGAIELSVSTVPAKEIPLRFRFPIDFQPENDRYACLTVVDTGCGIGEADLENIFDPFFSSKFPGRGLGLPVVLGILKAHGGAVAVESISGKGSLFRVFLPLSEEEVSIFQKEKHLLSSLAGSVVVLLVDDEDMMREMTSTMLTLHGATVFSARDGIEALEMFREHLSEIDLVLCDLVMPRAGGFETLSSLRKLKPDAKVVLMSGYDRKDVMNEILSERPDAFLQKPFTMQALIRMVKEILES